MASLRALSHPSTILGQRGSHYSYSLLPTPYSLKAMQDPIYTRIESLPRPTPFAASGLLLLAAVGLWLSELAATLLGSVLPVGEALASALYYLPFVLLPVALYMRRRPGLGEAMRLNPMPPGPMLAVGLLALLTVFAASALTTAWGLGLDALGLRRLTGYTSPEGEAALASAILVQAALPAVCEELLFRGFMLSAWESRGTWFAVGVTAGLFALLHGNLYGIPAYLLVGGVSGFITFALDSVYAGMVYHTAYNAACLVIPWLVAGQEEAEAAAVSPFSLALETLTILALMAALLSALRLWARTRGVEPIPRIRRPLETRDKLMLAAAIFAMMATMVIILALSAMA